VIEDLSGPVAASGLRHGNILRLIPSLPVLAGLFAFVVADVYWIRLIHDPDIYLHITAGKWMLAHWALPASDQFSHSMPGAHWIVHEWLSELVLGTLFTLFGWHGLVLLAASCFAISVAILTRRLLDRGEAMTSLAVAICAGFLLEPHLLARPHILALPLMVGWCAALVAARDARRRPSLALLPLMTLWANLHGSFMVGLGLAVFLAIEAIIERGTAWRAELEGWALFTSLAAIAAGITPSGIETFLLPLRFMGMTVLQNSFTEWLSPNFHVFQPLEIWLLGLILAGYGLGLKLPFWRLLFVIGLLHMALQAERHGDLVAVLVPLLAWPALGPQLRARIEAGGTTSLAQTFAAFARPATGPALAVTAVTAMAIGAGTLLTPMMPEDGPLTPEAALTAAKAMGLSGPVFNAEGFGGYLIFEGIPVFIDGRIEMYGTDFLDRYLKAAGGNETTLATMLDQYHIGWALLEPQSGAALVLKRLPGWQQVYSDDYAVVDRRIEGSAR
jgi:hypothetical protein